MSGKPLGLRFGALEHAAHLCVDMQRLFSKATPWMQRVLPTVARLVAARARENDLHPLHAARIGQSSSRQLATIL